MRPIRVLQLVAGCQVGGLEVMALSLVQRLSDEFEFEVLCYDAEGPLKTRYEEMGVRVSLVPRRPGVDLRYVGTLARHLREADIDVIHAHNDTALFYGALAAKLAGGGRRVVFTAHDARLSRTPIRLLNRALARLTTRAVAVSESGRSRLTEREGFRERSVTVLHNGADERLFERAPDRRSSRLALGLPEDAEVVGTVTRLHPVKNVPLLIRAFARVAAERDRAVLVVAGDGPERVECERVARDLGVRDRIHFLGTRSDVARILSSLDVFVLTSVSEGLPVAVVEAMAAERPVVSTDVGAVSELVHDGENGWLVPPGSAAGIAERVIRLLEEPARARSMGERGAEMFRDRFTLERMAAGYGRVYREAVEGVS